MCWCTQANSGGNASVPAARNYAPTWTHTATGTLWMWSGMWSGFGSQSDGDDDGGYLADLWSFVTATMVWTKHAALDPSPAPRTWSNFWSSESGEDLWVHGGTAAGGDGGVALNDMWHLSMASMTWTMVYNSSKPEATYNSSSKADINPGFRSNSYTTAVGSGEATELYMYGGEGFSSCPSCHDPYSPPGIHDEDYQDV